MLKHKHLNRFVYTKEQPPSGGCVLKLPVCTEAVVIKLQPPSGGCVLKQEMDENKGYSIDTAAFRRLCVETIKIYNCRFITFQPPSGGCVLKLIIHRMSVKNFSAAFRRLCVETRYARLA